ncbi:MAG TPA: S4 domain-containing protein [Gemmatimonadaceae bacterium]|nr:S4 domain-containing protein [Gemmatimonadaceae bacterium]
MSSPAPSDRVRLDKWLWAARFFKTRSLAAEAIEGGKVELNGERAKRAKGVQPGDRVRVRMGPYLHEVVVRALSERRGPASEAALLYEETEESRKGRERMAEQMKSITHDFAFERGKPSKKERRDLHRFRDRG